MYQKYIKTSKPNPITKANILSRITFLFAFPLFRRALKKDLKEEDIYDVVGKFKSEKLGDDLQKLICANKKNNNYVSVQKLIWKFCGLEYFSIGIVQLFTTTGMILFNPYFISKIVSYFSNTRNAETKLNAIYMATYFLGANILYSIYTHFVNFWTTEIGIKVKMALSSVIYRKSLKLNPLSLSSLTIGNIITLLNKDVEYLEQAFQMTNEMIIGIFHLGIFSYLIYIQTGGLITIILQASILLIIVCQFFLSYHVILKRRIATAKAADVRMHITQECLSAIKIVKMYTWENYFITKIANARSKEIHHLKLAYFGKFVTYCIGDLSLKIAYYVLAMVYFLLGFSITTENAYYIISCFAVIRLDVIVYIPLGFAYLCEMKAATNRIELFLNKKEIHAIKDDDKFSYTPVKITFKDLSIKIKDRAIFQNVSLDITKGLYLLTGLMGSGKTILIKTILKEHEPTSGSLVVNGTISYASEDPWIFPGSLQQNILFGEKYDEKRYKRVIKVCALEYDLKLLTEGDQTLIGSRGVNISKGQKARITLARTVYRKSDIYLIDDCLSCLDIHVQDIIFQNCIKKFLKGKLIIMVTHNKKYFRQVNKNITMNDYDVQIENNTSTDNDTNQNVQDDLSVEDMKNPISPIKEYTENEKSKLLQKNVADKVGIYREENKEGIVDLSMYLRYIKLGGGATVAMLIFVLMAVSEGILIWSEKLISKWVNAEQNLYNLMQNNSSYNSTLYFDTIHERNYELKLYSIAMGSMITLYIIRTVSIYLFACQVSVNIHKILIRNVVNATMEELDLRLIGKILNRFSKDLSSMDDYLTCIMYYTLTCLVVTVGIIILIASTNSYFLLPTSILILVICITRKLYLPAGRSLKRLDAATRSPIVGHLNDTLEGLSTIRAFQNQSIVTEEFDKHLDLYTSAYHMGRTVDRTLCLFLDIISIIFIAVIIYLFLIFDSGILASNVGLGLTQAFMLTGLLQFGTSQWAELENRMTSVERVTEYTNIKTEYKNKIEIPNWPKSATIKFKNVHLTYKNSPNPVLKNLNFSVKSKDKIGIVGRSGSGKSSIISCLLRLYDYEGHIYIDDVDTRNICINFLRSNIAVIPQDPIIFSGTLRENIDPNNKYPDETIWKALELVELKNKVHDLNAKVSDLNVIFSSGQKQLICLARALIQKSKIIVLDEATANMDSNKDEMVHKILHKIFADCTFITIVHRLHSVLNVEKVMVIDDGEIVEFDTPQKLLENSNSKFSSMIHDSEFYI